jgi:hypothetical protein
VAWASLGLALCAWTSASLCTFASAQDAPTDPPPGLEEGALRNDAFLPTNRDASQALFEGDAAWVAGREGPGVTATLAIVFDGWRLALTSSTPGDGVLGLDPNGAGAGAFPDPDGTLGRRADGVQAAVLRRLESLPPHQRATWRSRFGSTAQDEWTTAPRDLASLGRLERELPGMRVAVLAAIACADFAAESGRPVAAAVWLERATRHLNLLDGSTPDQVQLEEAIDCRAAALPAPAPSASAFVDGAKTLDLVRADRLEFLTNMGRPMRGAPLGRGLRPGLVTLNNGSVVVQTARSMVWLPEGTLNQEQGGRIERQSLEELLDVPMLRPLALASAGGWSMFPATDGERVVMVVDRGTRGRLMRGINEPARGNYLACLRSPDTDLPQPEWLLSSFGTERFNAGEWEPDESAQAPFGVGTWEILPGPCIADGRVFVLTRRMHDPGNKDAGPPGEIWLCAFDLATARPLWRRFITRAADLRRENESRMGSSDIGTASMPLALVGNALVIGTNVGLVAVIDPADGRLAHAFRYRRRPFSSPGWPGSRVPEGDARGFVIAPFDSDYAYHLALTPTANGVLLDRPLPIRADQDLVDGLAESKLFLGRDGRNQALRWRAESGASGSAMYLGIRETFNGRALGTKYRVLASSNQRLYMFDRDSELGLLHAEPLVQVQDGDRGGDVIAANGRVLVLGDDTLWVLRPR